MRPDRGRARLLVPMVACNDSQFDDGKASGDPMEAALLVLCGATMMVGTLAVLYFGMRTGSEARALTMAFTTFFGARLRPLSAQRVAAWTARSVY